MVRFAPKNNEMMKIPAKQIQKKANFIRPKV